MSELNSNKQEDEDLQEKHNEIQTEAKKLSRKRKATDSSGTSKTGEEIQMKQKKTVKEFRSTDRPGTSKYQDDALAEEDTESATQNRIQYETKCCKKTCMNVVSTQVRQQLNQEYKRQLSQSREHGRSYLRKYFYPYKNSERFNDGTPMNVMFQFRIPPKVPFDDGDKKIEICQRAFMKIFELRDIWAPWHVKVEYGKLMKSRRALMYTLVECIHHLIIIITPASEN